MARAPVPFETVRRARDVDPGGKTLRIHLLDGRHKEEVDTFISRHPGIACFIARIGHEIGRVIELCRVDKNARYGDAALAPRGADQCNVTFVPCPHRRHQADDRAPPELLQSAPKAHDCPNNLHNRHLRKTLTNGA